MVGVLGFALPQFGESAGNDIGVFAAEAERLGAASLWVADRLLTAVEPSVGYTGRDSIPDAFRTALDPFTALTVAAASTRRSSSVPVCWSRPGIHLFRWPGS